MQDNMASPRTYVVAVSGGVDSMVLLHVLHHQNLAHKKWLLIVAHIDHGIRDDSAEDRRLVARTAQKFGLPFVYHEAGLGPGASEALARTARYNFLRRVQNKSAAQAILTAHHQDDVLETAVINMLRGSGRKGLTALGSHEALQRPLLNANKASLIDYAKLHGLEWREDSTNTDTAYLRNHVRHNVLPKFDESSRGQLAGIISAARRNNHEIDTLINELLVTYTTAGRLDRAWFTALPHAVAREIMASWLRSHGLKKIETHLLERLVVAAKVAAAGRRFDIYAGYFLTVWQDDLALAGPER